MTMRHDGHRAVPPGTRRRPEPWLGRTVAGLTATVVLAGVTACSGDPAERYCDVVADEQQALSEAAGAQSPGALLEAVDSLRRLADAAPGDVRADWMVVVDRVEELRAALEDADVDPATYDPEKPPEGLTAEQREAITDAAVGLAEPATLEAVSAIEQQALDVCQTPLGI